MQQSQELNANDYANEESKLDSNTSNNPLDDADIPLANQPAANEKEDKTPSMHDTKQGNRSLTFIEVPVRSDKDHFMVTVTTGSDVQVDFRDSNPTQEDRHSQENILEDLQLNNAEKEHHDLGILIGGERALAEPLQLMEQPSEPEIQLNATQSPLANYESEEPKMEIVTRNEAIELNKKSTTGLDMESLQLNSVPQPSAVPIMEVVDENEDQ